MDIINVEDVNILNRIEHNKKLQELKKQGIATIAGRLFGVKYLFNIVIILFCIYYNNIFKYYGFLYNINYFFN
jgi:hypothetical protein